jgi:hypothetical protein
MGAHSILFLPFPFQRLPTGRLRTLHNKQIRISALGIWTNSRQVLLSLTCFDSHCPVLWPPFASAAELRTWPSIEPLSFARGVTLAHLGGQTQNGRPCRYGEGREGDEKAECLAVGALTGGKGKLLPPFVSQPPDTSRPTAICLNRLALLRV